MKQVIERALPHLIRRRGSTWRVRGPELAASVDGTLEGIAALRSHGPTDLTVYKHNERKLVFAVEAEPPTVAKVVLLKRLHHRIRPGRFAHGEAENLLVAEERGLPVPRLLGAGRLLGPAGLTDGAAPLLERLSGATTVASLLRDARDEPPTLHAVLMATIDLFEAIHRTGCHHIDVNANNVLRCDTDGGHGPHRLIDFQHAAFHDRPSAEILLFELAHFARTIEAVVPDEVILEWRDAVLDRVGVADTAGRFDHYLGTTLSRRQRRDVRP